MPGLRTARIPSHEFERASRSSRPGSPARPGAAAVTAAGLEELAHCPEKVV